MCCRWLRSSCVKYLVSMVHWQVWKWCGRVLTKKKLAAATVASLHTWIARTENELSLPCKVSMHVWRLCSVIKWWYQCSEMFSVWFVIRWETLRNLVQQMVNWQLCKVEFCMERLFLVLLSLIPMPIPVLFPNKYFSFSNVIKLTATSFFALGW